jgi:hypothetical protein
MVFENLITVVVFLVSPGLVGGVAEPPRAVLGATELRTRLVKPLEPLKSIYVSYESHTYDPTMFAPGTYLHRELAAMAPCYLWHVSAHGHAKQAWNADPLMQRTSVSTARWTTEIPVNRAYFGDALQPHDPLPGSMPFETYFLATGIWLLGDRPPPRTGSHPLVSQEVAVSDEYSEVRPAQEQFDGHWCHVLERPGRDRIWIDVERNGTVMAREWCSPQNGAVMQRFEMGDHREFLSGVWLPGWIRNIQYDYRSQRKSEQRRKLKDARLDIIETKVNGLDESFFDFRPPAGAVRIAKGSRPKQTHPGGLDHLDDLVSWCRANAPREKLPPQQPSNGRFFGIPVFLGIVGLWWVQSRFRTDR